jgi:hypothetical protein
MRMKTFVKENPTRVAAWVSSTVALVLAALVPEIPTEPAVVFVLSTLGLGEYAQRKENNMWDEALHTPVPEGE